jgi:MtN3 and saliva related transmembrane protein
VIDMANATTVIGLMAAFLTSLSYYPQLKKSWQTGSTGDLSLGMFSALTTGVGLWIVYGVLRDDAVVILANVVAFVLLAGIVYLKLRAVLRGRDGADQVPPP